MIWGPRGWVADWVHGMWRHEPHPPPDLAIPGTTEGSGSRATGGDTNPPTVSPPQPQHNEPPTNCGFVQYLRTTLEGGNP